MSVNTFALTLLSDEPACQGSPLAAIVEELSRHTFLPRFDGAALKGGECGPARPGAGAHAGDLIEHGAPNSHTRDTALSDIRHPVSVCLSGPRLDSESLSSVCTPWAGLNRGGRAAVYVGCAPRGGAFGRVDENLRERHLVR